MKITITRQDIQQGQRRDPEQCAVARALFRAGLNHCGVMGPSVMIPDRCGRLISLPLPADVGDWIFDFDAGKAVRPISFEVDLGHTPQLKRRCTKVSGSSAKVDRPSSLLSIDDLNSVEKLKSGSICKSGSLVLTRSRSKNRVQKRVEFDLV